MQLSDILSHNPLNQYFLFSFFFHRQEEMDKFLGYQIGVGFGVDGAEGGGKWIRSIKTIYERWKEIPLSPPREERGNIN